MIAALLAAALQAASAPAAAATPAPGKPAAAAAPSAPDADPDAPTAEGLASLRLAYHDSCEVRLYGEYDDMCSGLSDQIRRYRAALARAERQRRPR